MLFCPFGDKVIVLMKRWLLCVVPLLWLAVTPVIAQDDDDLFGPIDNREWTPVYGDLFSMAYPPDWEVETQTDELFVFTNHADDSFEAQMRLEVRAAATLQSLTSIAEEADALLRFSPFVVDYGIRPAPAGDSFFSYIVTEEAALSGNPQRTVHQWQYLWPLGSREIVFSGELRTTTDALDDVFAPPRLAMSSMFTALNTIRIQSDGVDNAWPAIASIDATFSVRAPIGWDRLPETTAKRLSLYHEATASIISISVTDLGEAVPLSVLESGFADTLLNRGVEDMRHDRTNRPFGDTLRAIVDFPLTASTGDGEAIYRRELIYNALRGSQFIIMNASAPLEQWSPEIADTLQAILDTFAFADGEPT
ncbi:MAG: hypothetical protein EA396_02225 [Anaerolineaceae bacterium]|nr:MAG: hypothetical protein EA396_02225 [Anaerolineaceae bacterium]